MQCLKPIELADSLVGCGQCLNCRIDKQRVWTCRILLESKYYPASSFVTLTYEDEVVPLTGEYETNLLKSDLQKFIKDYNYANRSFNSNVRYFAVGEYGEKTQRAHFHLIMFGEDPDTKPELIHKTWNKGHTLVAEVSRQRCAYVAQYCLKKLGATNPDLGDRNPEFSIQSRRPGIGSPALNYLENLLCSKHGSEYIAYSMDVFKAIRIDGQIYPLGDYLRSILRHRLGIPQTRPERMLHFGCNESFDPEGAVEHLYGEEDEKWWETYGWKSDIMNFPTPHRDHEQKKRKLQELPEINRQAKVRSNKKGKARLRNLGLAI